MMDRNDLARLVHEALEHLHSRSYLATHPLAAFLGDGQQPVSADVVRQTLLDAIEQLQPVGDAPSVEAERRRYRQLVLRYVEGQTLEQAAHALDISMRQASRDHQQAIAALAGLIEIARRERGIARIQPPREMLPGEVSPAVDLAEEAAKVAASEEGGADLVEVLGRALGLVERLAGDRSVDFVASLSDTLPPVAISPTLLRQALLNLLVYTCEVTPASRAVLSATDTARGVILRVTRRDGESERPTRPPMGRFGIEGHPELPRGESETATPPPIISLDAQRLLDAARQLLEAQGGQVETGLAEGGSALLRVILPPIPLYRVLVVDDNPELASLFRRYLRHEPYRVIQAVTGARALDLARELRPDLILLDVMIPSQDGWEILQSLRADPETSRAPIVICSVLPEQTLALSLGVDAFLPKPVTRAALLEALQRWCRNPPERSGRSSPSASPPPR